MITTLSGGLEEKTSGVFAMRICGRSNPLRSLPLSLLLMALLVLVTGQTNSWGAGAPGRTPSEPEQVLKEFYKALSKKDCSKALQLRPDYNIKKCKDTDWVNVVQIENKAKKPGIALIYVKVRYSQDKKKSQWAGHTMLIHNGKKWVIGGDRFWWNEYQFSLDECRAKVAQYQSPVLPSSDDIKWEVNQPIETGDEPVVTESHSQTQPKVALPPVLQESGLETDSQQKGIIQNVETMDQRKMQQGDFRTSALLERHTAPRRVSLQDEFNITNHDPIQVEPDMEGCTFGSAIILHKLWTSQELKGSAEDKKIQPLGKPDHVPPQRLIPKFKNQPLFPCVTNSIRSVKPFRDRKVIALTFDLCERTNEITGYDAKIVKYLRDNMVKSTFFAGGKWMRSHPDKTEQLMADPLFEVGNHSWSHANLRVANDKDIVKEILWTQVQYELLWEDLERRCKALGIDLEMSKIPRIPTVFRFPYGTCSPASLNALSQFGLAAIQWDVVTGDPAAGQTAENITKTVENQTKPGSIIVCHANGRGHGTAEALPRFIPDLRKRGFEFVTVSELLRLGQVDAYDECFELRPGDNHRYDKIR